MADADVNEDLLDYEEEETTEQVIKQTSVINGLSKVCQLRLMELRTE